MTQKTGRSPVKSRRRAQQRQRKAVQFQAALNNISTMSSDLLKNVESMANMAKEKIGESIHRNVFPEEEPEGSGG